MHEKEDEFGPSQAQLGRGYADKAARVYLQDCMILARASLSDGNSELPAVPTRRQRVCIGKDTALLHREVCQYVMAVECRTYLDTFNVTFTTARCTTQD